MRRETGLRRLAVGMEKRWDAWRVARRWGRSPEHFRIVPFMGHGSRSTVVARGRVLDNPEPTVAVAGEGVWTAARRTIARFNTVELPGVPLVVRVGDALVETETDNEGYFHLRLETDLGDVEGWVEGEVGLVGPYRGLTDDYQVGFSIRVPVSDSRFGVISDIDDTLLVTGARSSLSVLRRTMTGSAITRKPVAGAAELCRRLAEGESGSEENPFFYLSSSPWNLYGFISAFLEYRQFPRGPVLLRDLFGGDEEHSHRSHKSGRIDEVLGLHPGLEFVLLGDSGQEDPDIYMDAVRRHPGRITAVFIRDVRRRQGLGAPTSSEVPFLVVRDWVAAAESAAELGLIAPQAVRTVRRAVDSAT